MYKEVKLSSVKITYCPLLVYSYKSVTDSLQEMLNWQIFFNCEAWRSMNNIDQYCDVYDGDVWRDFMTYDGQVFLSVPYNFAFQLNIDWFQPF